MITSNEVMTILERSLNFLDSQDSHPYIHFELYHLYISYMTIGKPLKTLLTVCLIF